MIEPFEQETSKRWSIAGSGVVGGAVIEMLAKEGVAARHGLNPDPDFVLRTDGWHRGGREGHLTGIEPTELPPDTDVLFVATAPTVDDEPTYSLIKRQLGQEKTVITAEKTSLAENFSELTSLPGQLGYWATVGGGARLIPSLELFTLDPENVREIHIAPNATLTFIFGMVQKGSTLVEAVELAEKAGLVEPGDFGLTDELHIIQKEAKLDVPRKISILWNTIFPHLEPMPADALPTELDNDETLEAIRRVRSYRYLVSLYPETEAALAKKGNKGRIGGFKHYHAGCVAIGGCQRGDKSTLQRNFRNSRGPQGGYYIRLGAEGEQEDDGVYGSIGVSAGARATATAMLDNLIHIRRSLGQLP